MTLHSSLISIDTGAFCESPLLETVRFGGGLQKIGSQAFYATGIKQFTLPDCEVAIEEYAFVSSPLTTPR